MHLIFFGLIATTIIIGMVVVIKDFISDYKATSIRENKRDKELFKSRFDELNRRNKNIIRSTNYIKDWIKVDKIKFKIEGLMPKIIYGSLNSNNTSLSSLRKYKKVKKEMEELLLSYESSLSVMEYGEGENG